MKDIRCIVGRHDWQHHVTKEMGGPDAGYDLCSRCGAEKNVYGKPPSKGVAGSGGFELLPSQIPRRDRA